MTTNEKRLLQIFIILCLCALFGIYATARSIAIKELDRRISYYQHALEGIEQQTEAIKIASIKLDDLKKKSESRSTDQKTVNLTNAVIYLRTTLRNEGITPDRYTINGKYPKLLIEFEFKANPVAFFHFLRKQESDSWDLQFQDLTMKARKNSSLYDITFRIPYDD